MDVGFNEDQVLFRDVVQRFLQTKSSTTDVRRLMASPEGFDKAVWAQACGEIGLAGIHLPEEFGGSGFGAIELGIVAEEMGRHLYCGPFFASAIMAGFAICNEGTLEQKQQLLPGIAAGSTIATLVLDDLNTVERVGSQLTATSTSSGGNAEISGVAPMVIDAQVADLLVVAARSGDQVALFQLDSDSTGVACEPLEVVDSTRKLCRLTFKAASAERLGAGAPADLNLLWDQLNTMLANEMVGGAAHLFETTLDYMKLRVQFGRTIGSFQSLKHRCADLLMELELARAAAYDAARNLALVTAGETGEPYAANTAKALASDAYMQIARQAIQLRGGIGFTWEEDTHLWFKRAKSSEVLFGTSAWHRDQMIEKMQALQAQKESQKETANV